MKHYFIYEKNNGNILSKYMGSWPELQTEPGCGYIECSATDSAEDWFVSDGVLTTRIIQHTVLSEYELLADGIDEIQISSAPIGADITINNMTTGESVSGVIDGDDRFVTTSPGEYSITICKLPYIPFKGVFNAN